MIQSKDFRKGNFVYNTRLDIFKKGYIELEARHIYEMAIKESGQYYNKYVDEFEPIPLNEEWLLKLGFECYKPLNHYRKVIDDVWVQIYVNNGFWLSFVDLNGCETKEMPRRKVATVHQLQNLFYSLTVQELTLK